MIHYKTHVGSLSFSILIAISLIAISCSGSQQTLNSPANPLDPGAFRGSLHDDANPIHPPHIDAGLTCGQCHTVHNGDPMDMPIALCENCHQIPDPNWHSNHVGWGVNCLECHTGMGGGKPTDEKCLVCHSDTFEHDFGNDCTVCHYSE